MFAIEIIRHRVLFSIAILIFLAVSFARPALTASTTTAGVPSFAPASRLSAGTNPQAIGSADFNGDSKADIAVVNRGSANVSVRLGDGDGGFGVVTNFSVGMNPIAIAVGDFNGDGKADLAVANSGSLSDSGSVSVLIGDGAGGFGLSANLAVGMHPSAVVIADFNGDSKADLAVTNLDSDTVSVLLGDGLAGFGAANTFAVAHNPRSIAVADFNKDTRSDLAVANSGSNTVSILIGDGNGGFAAATSFGVGMAPLSVAVGDFNGDTKPDLVTANNTSNDVSVLVGDGAGGFAAATNFAAATSPYAVVVGDFYGDGKLDVAVSNSGSANVSVLLGDGAGNLSTATNFAVGIDPRSLAAGNFNGDSRVDLVVPDSGSDDVSLLLNQSVVTAIVSGTVSDAQSNPVAGTTVEAIDPATQESVTSSLSDASGHYSLTLALGTYTLRATPPDDRELTTESVANLVVTGDIVQNFTLAATVQLSGRLADRDSNALSNVTMSLANGSSSTPPETRSASDGTYAFRVIPGSYTLGLDYALAMDPSFNATATVSLSPDTIRDIAVQNRVLSGTVRNTNGQPVPNVVVKGCVTNSSFSGLTWNICNNTPGPRSDANGHYQMMMFPGSTTLEVTPALGGGLVGTTVSVDIQGDTTKDITLAPTPGQPTPTGNNVTVQGSGGQVSFAQVTTAGTTTFNPLAPATINPLPDGYFLSASSVAFDITTTASYQPPVDVCFSVPTATDAALFASLGLLHNESGQLIDRTTTRDFNTKSVCARVTTLSPFVVVERTTLQYSTSAYSVSEAAGSATVTVTRLGHLTTSAAVDFATGDGTAEQRTDYTAGAGTLTFAAGETTKTFDILVTDDLYVEGNETVTLNLKNATGGIISSASPATLTIVDNDTTTATTNPLDNADAQFFVRQHYYDFLSRAPDPGGLGFWASTIIQCGADQTCLRSKRIDASNAFFYELEFQQTGAYVFRLYRAAFGNNQPFPDPFADPLHPNEEKKLPSYAAFSVDRARVVGGANLSQGQVDLANAFVLRPEFITRYPLSLTTGDQFVDAVLAAIQSNMGVDLSSQRNALIALYAFGGRGAVLYRLADDNLQDNPINNRPLIDAEYNRAFVATQYFGYLRRDPDIGGFLFWLGQVNSAALRDVARQHAMVCSFVTSGEYQQRFSPVTSHGNQECQ
jgi:hypothetical protein